MPSQSTSYTNDTIKNAWAFAVAPYRSRLHKTTSAYQKVRITSCSKQARELGIREGMGYLEAKQILPEIRILVIGERKS